MARDHASELHCGLELRHSLPPHRESFTASALIDDCVLQQRVTHHVAAMLVSPSAHLPSTCSTDLLVIGVGAFAIDDQGLT
jgi:hypothetical protein